MNGHERKIAEAAIRAGRLDRYEDIYEAVAASNGMTADEVQTLLERLVSDGVLRKKGGPARNVNEDPQPRVSKGWFEKGDLWPK
jgi:hypothetical protein